MNAELFLALELLEREKGIPVTYMLEKVEAALVNAYKREFGNTGICRILLDPNKRDMKVYRQRNVVEVVTDPVCEISLADAQAISRRHKLGGVVEDVIYYTLSDGNEELSRTIIIIKKQAPTPKKYPRNNSQISKKPL